MAGGVFEGVEDVGADQRDEFVEVFLVFGAEGVEEEEGLVEDAGSALEAVGG